MLIIYVYQSASNVDQESGVTQEATKTLQSSEFTVTYILASLPSDKLTPGDIFVEESTGGQIVD